MATLESVVTRLEADADFQDEVKKDPVKALAQAAKEGPAFVHDVITYRIVVIALGVTVVGAVAGAVFLAWSGSANESPQILTALGSAAVGALAGLLAPSPGGK